jgi:adenosyl cobinamide kinase/adenosyl cobinamide phosphate guanylyltransferase|tara:strand:- start:2787 stop:3086 length:300 start_codon:yes stop_codon:yes gene_type:complete
MAINANDRLDRIEVKIDKLVEAMVSIARAEEKIVSMEKRFDFHEAERKEQWEKFEEFHQKIDKLEDLVSQNANTINIINRLFWIVLVAVVGALSTHLVL